MSSEIFVKSSVYSFCEKNLCNPILKPKGELEVKVDGLTSLLSADNKKSLSAIESEKNKNKNRIIHIGLVLGAGLITAIGVCLVAAVILSAPVGTPLIVVTAVFLSVGMQSLIYSAIAALFKVLRNPTVDVLQMTNKIADFSAAIDALDGKAKDAFVTIKPEADSQG